MTHANRTPLLRLCALAASTAACLSGCCLDVHYENESSEALRMVPVAPEVRLPPDAAAPEGTAVTRQSYTLEQDGQFTFHRSIEQQVASLGAEARRLGKEDAKRLGIDPFSGVRVRSVERDGPAGRGGLKPDDVITEFDGKAVTSVERLENLIEEKSPGDDVGISYQRDQKAFQTKVTLGSEKRIVDGEGFRQRLPVLDDMNRTGLRLAELTPEAHAGIVAPQVEDRGLLIINVMPGGPGFFADLRVKDLVTRVGETPVATLDGYAKALAGLREGDEVVFTVRRGIQVVEAEVEIDDDAEDQDRFNALGLVEYDGRPEGTEFSLIWSILCDYKSCFEVKKSDSSTRNVLRRHWSTALHLISWRSTRGGKKELRLLWFFPIAWGS